MSVMLYFCSRLLHNTTFLEVTYRSKAYNALTEICLTFSKNTSKFLFIISLLFL